MKLVLVDMKIYKYISDLKEGFKDFKGQVVL